MCFFRKKKPKVLITGNKYEVGDFVKFRHRGDLDPGYIYEVKLDNNDEIIYDIQIGGECPTIIENVKEKDIVSRK